MNIHTIDPVEFAASCCEQAATVGSRVFQLATGVWCDSVGSAGELAQHAIAVLEYAQRGGRFPKASYELLQGIAFALPNSWPLVGRAVKVRRALAADDTISATELGILAGLAPRTMAIHATDGKFESVQGGRAYEVEAVEAKRWLKRRGVKT